MLLVSTRIHSKRCALRAPDIHPVIACNQLAVVSLPVLQLDELQMSMQIIDMSTCWRKKKEDDKRVHHNSARGQALSAPQTTSFWCVRAARSRAYHRVAGRRAQQ